VLASVPVLAAIVVSALGVVPAEGDLTLARWRSGEALPRLEVRPGAERRARELAAGARPSTEGATPPACVADMCQVRVEIPGLVTTVRRPHRTELFATMLDRAGIEPFATIAWIFARTGLRVDWSPPDRGTGDPARWGNFTIRVRLRIDAMNRPALLERDKARDGKRSWKTFIAPGA
jgi:hypothetical protein